MAESVAKRLGFQYSKWSELRSNELKLANFSPFSGTASPKNIGAGVKAGRNAEFTPKILI